MEELKTEDLVLDKILKVVFFPLLLFIIMVNFIVKVLSGRKSCNKNCTDKKGDN